MKNKIQTLKVFVSFFFRLIGWKSKMTQTKLHSQKQTTENQRYCSFSFHHCFFFQTKLHFFCLFKVCQLLRILFKFESNFELWEYDMNWNENIRKELFISFFLFGWLVISSAVIDILKNDGYSRKSIIFPTKVYHFSYIFLTI